MHAHLVFVVKYRRSVFDKVAIDTLRAIFAVASNNINAQLI
jgi:REP element-mobilizing transposase RayT